MHSFKTSVILAIFMGLALLASKCHARPMAVASEQAVQFQGMSCSRCRFIGDFPSFGGQCRDAEKGEKPMCCKSDKETSQCHPRDTSHGGYSCTAAYASNGENSYRNDGSKYGYCCYDCK